LLNWRLTFCKVDGENSALGSPPFIIYDAPVIQLLRFVGVANAGVWFGAAVFVTFFAGPAFFSAQMIHVLADQRYYAGAAAQIILSRYFILQYLCAFIALAHLLAEWFYLGRRHSRFVIGLWTGLTVLILIGGLRLQPKLHNLHQTMYYGATAAEQAAATKSFHTWHGVSQTGNILVLVGLSAFFWRALFVSTEPTRFGGYGKYRG
jgi:hypothetical protein